MLCGQTAAQRGEEVVVYVYIKSEPNLWTVGFYNPFGEFQPESDYPNPNDAAKRVHWLNGKEAPDGR